MDGSQARAEEVRRPHKPHDVKGPGPNFQPAILITVDGQPHDEFARQLAYDEGGGVLLDGNGDIVRAR